jgi:APA family basic amino acid/polyamine antiporter
VLILRIRQPNLERRFRAPVLWLLAPLGMVFSLFLIIGWPWVTEGHFHMIGGLDMVTIWRFIIWMALGFVIYFSYGMWHSKLGQEDKS